MTDIGMGMAGMDALGLTAVLGIGFICMITAVAMGVYMYKLSDLSK